MSFEPMGERAAVLELVRQHGFNATAFQTLEEGYRYFFFEGGSVAYVDTGAAWVAAGAPLAATHHIPAVLAAFLRAATARGRRVCLFGTEDRLRRLVGASLRSFRIGEQPVWDPQRFGETLGRSRSLREQLRRARAKGVTQRLLTPAELSVGATREQITEVARRWQATRLLSPMEFLVRLELFSFPEERRCFVAEQAGRVLAVAGVVPVPARGGWFIEDLVRDPRAPNGTSELLIDAVMRWSAAQGSSWVTLGLAPLSGDVSPLLRMVRSSGRVLYDFSGLRSFRAKFVPDQWQPIYLSHPPTQRGWRSLLDAAIAFKITLAR